MCLHGTRRYLGGASPLLYTISSAGNSPCALAGQEPSHAIQKHEGGIRALEVLQRYAFPVNLNAAFNVTPMCTPTLMIKKTSSSCRPVKTFVCRLFFWPHARNTLNLKCVCPLKCVMFFVLIAYKYHVVQLNAAVGIRYISIVIIYCIFVF